MKIRNGFVSNSSSSSFTLGVPKGSTEEEICGMIELQIGEMKDFFLPEFRQLLIDTILKCKGDKEDINKKIKDFQKYLEEGHGKQEWVDWWQEKKDKNFDVYSGGFDDQEGPIEIFLCNQDFKIDEDNFFMENSSGY